MAVRAAEEEEGNDGVAGGDAMGEGSAAFSVASLELHSMESWLLFGSIFAPVEIVLGAAGIYQSAFRGRTVPQGSL